MGIFKGHIQNKTHKTLWIVENDSKKGAVAHKLEPNMKTPNHIDADGVKAMHGVKISGHSGWWKISDPVWATIEISEMNGSLNINSFPSILTRKVGELEFGKIMYSQRLGWGEKL